MGTGLVRLAFFRQSVQSSQFHVQLTRIDYGRASFGSGRFSV